MRPQRPARSTGAPIEYLKENAAFRRYVLRELEPRGPLLSREIEDHAARSARRTAGGARARWA